MIKVKHVTDWVGAYWITIEVQEQMTAEYGPMSEEEARAMLTGMKAFATPHIVQFDDI